MGSILVLGMPLAAMALTVVVLWTRAVRTRRESEQASIFGAMTLSGSFLLLILFACVPSAMGEKGDSWHDQVFEISVPKNWTVHRTQEEANLWKYEITDGGTLVFQAQVLKGGPRFIDCACARPEFYRHTNDAVYETWALELQLGEMSFITWKVAKDDMRLDIHAHAGAAEIGLLRQVVYSAHPRSTKP